ncbi:hypothetical protein CYMTET_26082 [Cymbomonas tetramitiformis]|uniref:Uncharacterized protein n=1 Tax=Cymbomonas tetramitiformis TaxID=36881 RepID=A0AAE0FU27_9CHLO|nr:hypothetical protein CYMTET_26082 [Cymbomonas tetramitiformis]
MEPTRPVPTHRTGEFRQNPKRNNDTTRDPTPNRGGARGDDPRDPKRTTTPTTKRDGRPQTPRRDAPPQEHMDYEKKMQELAEAKHSGRANVDSEVIEGYLDWRTIYP